MATFREVLWYTFDSTLHLAPWFMFAVVLGVVAQLFALDILARRAFAKHGVMAILLTTAIGAFSPFCSFTVVPLIRRFLAVGVPLSAVMAFWVASPSMDPEIFALSAAQLGIPISLTRLFGALALSLAAGFVVLGLERRGYLRNPLRGSVDTSEPVPSCGGTASADPEPSGSQAATVTARVDDRAAATAGPATATAAAPATSAPAPSSCSAAATVVDDGAPWWDKAKQNLRQTSVRSVLKDVWHDTVGLGKWFVVAMFVSGLIVYYVPDVTIAKAVGAGAWSVLIAALVSVPLYVNGVGAIPIIDGLLIKGMDPGAAVTFLLGGAVTTIPAMVAVRLIVNNRVFALYLGVSLIGSLVIGYLAQLWL